MLKRVAVLAAAAAALALGPARADSREQEDLHLSLTCKPPSFKIRRPLLVLNGACPLPDGVILKVNLSHVTESVSGATIQPFFAGAGNGTTEIEGKKFLYDGPIEGPGKYNVVVAIVDDLQEKHLVAEVKKKAGVKRSWQFEFLVWNDELVTQISPKLNEMHQMVTETRELIKKFERASANKEGWAAESKPLVAEGTKFQAKLEHSELKGYYPAAISNLYYTVRNVVNNAPYYTYGADGKFSGARDYHADGEKVKTFRGEEFNWDNLKRYIEDALPIAGREFCLWIVKDIRRTGASRTELTEAVKAQKAAPGVDFYQERLMKAGISDIDALEADIRGLKPDGSPKEPDKKQ
jgi:hypothetical protein